jgi:hypothetical protein
VTSQHYTVETDWQATPRVRAKVRRFVVAREGRDGPRFDAEALTAALCLNAKPLPPGVARRVKGNYGLGDAC